MDLFRYNIPNTFRGGEAINNWDSIAWTERYREPGDFEISARLSSGLRTFLPIGTLISHLDTLEVMVVENHQITEASEVDPLLKITGRSLQCILDQRVVGQNFNWAAPPASLSVSVVNLTAAYTWIQAASLINMHIATGTVVNASDAIPAVVAAYSVVGTSVSEARVVNRGPVLTRLNEILEIDDLGIKTIRSHNFTGYPNPGNNTTLLVHAGVDRRNSVVFSTKNGDIESADYLWSIKKLKNSALVSGQYVEQMVYGPETGRDRRVLLVDGKDLDGYLDTVPTGATLTSVRAAMTTLGNQALKAQKQIALSRTDVSTIPTYHYRTDYDIGDIVSVDSSYGPIASMRVVEFVEFVDENGTSAQPTLEMLET